MLGLKLDRQTWTWNLLLMSMRQRHICSQAMKQAAREAFENNMHHHDIMKLIAKA